MATVTVTSTPVTLDATGAAELGVTNTGAVTVFVNSQRVRPGQRLVFDARQALAVATQGGAGTSTVDTDIASPAKAASGGAAAQPVTRATSPVSGAYQVVQQTSNATDVGVNTLTRHVLPGDVGAEVLRLRFTNSGCGPNGDVDNANPVTVTASVGLTTTGPWFPVRRNGSRTMTLDGGADLESDPVALHIVAGGTFYTKTFLSVATGQVWTAQTPPGVIGTDYWATQSATETDLTTSTAALTGTAATRVFAPIVVADGVPSNVARLAIIGDSISGGIGDTTSGGGSSRGFVHRVVNGVLPWARIAVSGSKLSNIVDPAVGRRRLVLIRGCNVANVLYGTNDIFTASRTLAQLQADSIILWTILRGMGIVPVANTITPQSTSTDSWATTTNQAVKAQEPVRVALNDWLRAGAPMAAGVAVAVGTAGAVLAGAGGHPLAAYVEVADTVESARNSGLWKADGTTSKYTTDGTHPTTFGHTAMSAAIVPATYAALAA
jgi:lysophospholipase L1-like esterase